VDGTGRTAWIIDTGIDLDHPDLNVDLARSVNFVNTGKNSPDDANGHGTHVAGTIGARDNDFGVVGVAAGANVVAVRVLDRNGSGAYSWVIAGVDYVAQTAAAGDVANMSLGGPPSDALDLAVSSAASQGVLFSLAAGNESAPASESSPARVEHLNAYTVSAVDETDCFAWFSNYGAPPVDVAAPGVAINSTFRRGGYEVLNGTSMAAPHVAGVLLLGELSTLGQVAPAENCVDGGDPDGDPDPIAHFPEPL
jgi:subtilisin family serine protease